ncbi:hypothetical protein RGU44_24860, partial [Pseudomonas sp. 5C2]|uniref:hypothetical protein n=1 Tax=Pseudomonas sp. 5C2 TaxID=3048588 RepID=UPI002AB482F8
AIRSVNDIDVKQDIATIKITTARRHRHIYIVGSCLIIPACAAFFSVIVVTSLPELFFLTPVYRRVIYATVFSIILSITVYAARADYKKRDPMNIWEPPVPRKNIRKILNNKLASGKNGDHTKPK